MTSELSGKARLHAELAARQSAGMLDAEGLAALASIKAWLDENLSPPGGSAEEMESYREIERRVSNFLRKEGE